MNTALQTRAKSFQAIQAIRPFLGDALVVACNGYPSRELWALAERPRNFYMIGSMSLAAAIGLGLALARPSRRIIALDGDGNLLMGLGTLANVGAAKPANFYHIVIDNGSYASTGGQRTARTPLERVASSCGYVYTARAALDLGRAYRDLFDGPGPSMLVVEVEPGTLEKLPRVGLAPPDLARRFSEAAR